MKINWGKDEPFLSLVDEVEDVSVVLFGDAEVKEDSSEKRQVVDTEEVLHVPQRRKMLKCFGILTFYLFNLSFETVNIHVT